MDRRPLLVIVALATLLSGPGLLMALGPGWIIVLTATAVLWGAVLITDLEKWLKNSSHGDGEGGDNR